MRHAPQKRALLCFYCVAVAGNQHTAPLPACQRLSASDCCPQVSDAPPSTSAPYDDLFAELSAAVEKQSSQERFPPLEPEYQVGG